MTKRDRIEFEATLGDIEDDSIYALSATTAGTQGHSVHIFTPEEFVKILQLPEVRKAIAQHFTLDSATESQQKETIRQLAERVTELQHANDTLQEQLDATWSVAGREAFATLMRLFEGKKLLSEVVVEVERLVKHDKNIQLLVDCWDVAKVDNVLERALTKPTLASALSYVADWDNERAVRQALRNVGPDNRGETGDGGLWNTTFEHLFTRVLDAWPELSVAKLTLRERTSVAGSLWQLLDDIDTSSDQIKPDDIISYRLFYRRILDIASKRHQFLKSDGYKLTWPNGEDLQRIIGSALKGESWATYFGGGIHGELANAVAKLHNQRQEPVPMLLHCPMCHTKHIDEGEFATRPHHTHACQGFVRDDGYDEKYGKVSRRCGHVWRPALVPTVGVETLPGFLNDPTVARDK